MSMLLVHELHEARDRILLLKQRLDEAKAKELPAYRKFIDEQIASLEDGLQQARIPESYRVAVVGRFKVGKSSFVNKLVGERLAGVHTNPETAAISIFRYGDEARAEVELISASEWDRLKADYEEDPKHPEVKRYDSFITFNERSTRKEKNASESPRPKADLAALIREWVTPAGKVHTIRAQKWDTKEGKKAFLSDIKRFTSGQEPLHYLVNKLTVYAPIPILRDQIELIDTPGLDDTEFFRVRLTEELVKDVDAILFLTSSGASYSNSDKDFIVRQLRQKQIKHLQLIVTKCDETFKNACTDARANDDDEPTYKDFTEKETKRVRELTKDTLNELLQSNQLTDDEGYYYLQQLDNVPVQLVSTTFHDEGDQERGGIAAVRDGLYRTLSTSNRFEQARTILSDRLDSVLERLRRAFNERLNTLEGEFDPAKVRAEIESIRAVLSKKIDAFGERSGEALGLLKKDQAAFFKTLPVHLDNVELQAKDVLGDSEKADLGKFWKTRRYGGWGYLGNLQSRVADRVFPKVETVLNELRSHLESFMSLTERQLGSLQSELAALEADRQLSGLEPIALASIQLPLFEGLRRTFQSLGEQERDGIVSKLEAFVTDSVKSRLDQAREEVSNIWGKGTTVRQNDTVSDFYGKIRALLAEALRTHLDHRIHEFAEAIQTNAESVVPRIREGSEGVIRERVAAIESTLAIAAEGKKEQVAAYLGEMVALLRNFAANPEALPPVRKPVLVAASAGHESDEAESIAIEPPTTGAPAISEQHYEIADGATGYTYERIFRPYIDDAASIVVEDPYIRMPHQVDNFARFCALGIRCGAVKKIELITGKQWGEDTDEADSRLETLKRDLQTRGIALTWERKTSIHDREIRFDNGWIVKIGRGLDIYYKPETWIGLEAADFSLRRCRQTKVDVYRTS